MSDYYMDPFGFRAADKRRAEWQDKAKSLFLPGIDPADLRPGMRVTISPNLRREDNSWTDQVHTVLAVNQSHVQTRMDKHWLKEPLMLLAVDHHFYSAADFEAPEAPPPAGEP